MNWVWKFLSPKGDNVKRDAIENLDLKIIRSTRDDPNNVDVKAATEKKIPVLFTPKRNTISVAELTVGVMIALVRNVYKSETVSIQIGSMSRNLRIM